MGFHFTRAPVTDTWTNGLSVWAKEDPGGFGLILLFISLAEGESVGHVGDNFRGMSTKVAGDLGFDWMGIQKKLSAKEAARYKVVELKPSFLPLNLIARTSNAFRAHSLIRTLSFSAIFSLSFLTASLASPARPKYSASHRTSKRIPEEVRLSHPTSRPPVGDTLE
jgi:hypothetical protein